MAILIGGIAHNRKIHITQKWFVISVPANNRQPKQQIKTRFTQCKYERTGIVRNGEVVYRFVSGYYPPM